jgi:hypothetical protein
MSRAERDLTYDAELFASDLDEVGELILARAQSWRAIRLFARDVIVISYAAAVADYLLSRLRGGLELDADTAADLVVALLHVYSPRTVVEDVDGLATTFKQIRSMLIEKNASYGDSALSPVRIFASQLDALQQILVRADDKLSRMLRGGLDTKIADGEDTLFDLIGYLVIFLVGVVRSSRGY